MENSNPIRSTMFLYISSFVGMGLGYLYWLLVAKIASPDTVGVASTAMTIIAMALSVADLGIAPGLPRFLGRSAGKRQYSNFRKYLFSSLKLLLASAILVSSLIFLLSDFIEVQFFIPITITIVIIITIVVANLVPPLLSALVSILRTDYHALCNISGAVAKIIFGLLFIMLGMGAMGIVLGSSILYIVVAFLASFSIIHLLHKQGGMEDEPPIERPYRDVVTAGLPSYIPGTIQTFGTQLGILFVFGSVGASQTGYYYMALQIYAIAVLFPNIIMTLLLPYISAQPENDGWTIRQGIKFAQTLSFPIVALLLLYPYIPLLIIGDAYVSASLVLQILTVSIPFVAITVGASTLAYARGKYNIVLGIGLLTNIPRMLFYFILTPVYAGVGAALAFLIGSITGLVGALLASRKMTLNIGISSNILPAIPPFLVLMPLWIFSVPWYIGVPLELIISFFAYARFGIIKHEEVTMIGRMILPQTLLNDHKTLLLRALEVLFGKSR
jgi:O-antigen/teichoic acid export membrane protein